MYLLSSTRHHFIRLDVILEEHIATMGGTLTILIDNLSVELIDAHVFTPGQGICLEKLSAPLDKSNFVFKRGLAFGSWYDVLVRTHSSRDIVGSEAYMVKGIYLAKGKQLKLSDILQNSNRIDNGEEWQCGYSSCQNWNENGSNMCLHCYKNCARKVVFYLAFIPVIGLPFSITHGVLETGRAAHTKRKDDMVAVIHQQRPFFSAELNPFSSLSLIGDRKFIVSLTNFCSSCPPPPLIEGGLLSVTPFMPGWLWLEQ